MSKKKRYFLAGFVLGSGFVVLLWWISGRPMFERSLYVAQGVSVVVWVGVIFGLFSQLMLIGE